MNKSKLQICHMNALYSVFYQVSLYKFVFVFLKIQLKNKFNFFSVFLRNTINKKIDVIVLQNILKLIQ